MRDCGKDTALPFADGNVLVGEDPREAGFRQAIHDCMRQLPIKTGRAGIEDGGPVESGTLEEIERRMNNLLADDWADTGRDADFSVRRGIAFSPVAHPGELVIWTLLSARGDPKAELGAVAYESTIRRVANDRFLLRHWGDD